MHTHTHLHSHTPYIPHIHTLRHTHTTHTIPICTHVHTHVYHTYTRNTQHTQVTHVSPHSLTCTHSCQAGSPGLLAAAPEASLPTCTHSPLAIRASGREGTGASSPEGAQTCPRLSLVATQRRTQFFPRSCIINIPARLISFQFNHPI